MRRHIDLIAYGLVAGVTLFVVACMAVAMWPA